jgi:hypothetical protein
MAGTNRSRMLNVHNPMGYPPKMRQIHRAPRLDTREGKLVLGGIYDHQG